MHAICAVAGRNLCNQIPLPQDEAQDRVLLAVEHYTSALRLLHPNLRECKRVFGLNCVLATLWLMIIYERIFGDGCGTGLNAHLRGAAALFQERLHCLNSPARSRDSQGYTNCC